MESGALWLLWYVQPLERDLLSCTAEGKMTCLGARTQLGPNFACFPP